MKRKWLWLSLALIPLVVVGLMRLRLEADILATLPADVPEVRALKWLRDGFAGGNDLLIALEAPDTDGAAAATTALAERLRKRADLVKEVRWAQPMEEQTRDGAALLAWALQNADPAKFAELKTRLEGDGATKQLQSAIETMASSPDNALVQRLSYDPLGLMDCLDTSAMSALGGSLFGLISDDGKFRVLLITPAGVVSNYRSAEAWLKLIDAEIDGWRKENSALAGATTIRKTGEPAFQAEIGAGIARDMSGTIGLTEVLIALLFWIMFRRLKPLLWIQALLILSMVITLGLGGLLVGKLSIMSLGFAAIVLGIVVDYAVLIITEAREHPDLTSADLRKLAAPGIIAGGCTTATVFLSLLFSGLPGLAELGLLVALGVLVGLAVMIGLAPKLAAGRQIASPVAHDTSARAGHGLAIFGTVLLFGGMAVVFAWRGLPAFESQAEALRPSKSESMDAWQWIQERLGRENEASVPVLITGPTETLRERTRKLEATLDAAVISGTIVRHALPTMLVADPAAQKANRSVIEWLIQEQPRLEKEMDAAGFTEAALAMLRGLTPVWKKSLEQSWPQDATVSDAAPVLGRILATGSRATAAGMKADEGIVLASVSIAGKPGLPDRARLDELVALLRDQEGATAAGWETLGGALSSLVKRDLNRQLLPIMGILAVTLLITFRNARDLLLSLVLLASGLGALAATMSIFGLSWNLASLAAIPLLLGTGIDYGIHLLLALKRTGNDIVHVRRTTGRAVFFSGMTTVIGFSSLFFAGNRGISSLGLACCLGTLWIMLIVLWLLPHWRAWLGRGTSPGDT